MSSPWNYVMIGGGVLIAIPLVVRWARFELSKSGHSPGSTQTKTIRAEASHNAAAINQIDSPGSTIVNLIGAEQKDDAEDRRAALRVARASLISELKHHRDIINRALETGRLTPLDEAVNLNASHSDAKQLYGVLETDDLLVAWDEAHRRCDELNKLVAKRFGEERYPPDIDVECIPQLLFRDGDQDKLEKTLRAITKALRELERLKF